MQQKDKDKNPIQGLVVLKPWWKRYEYYSVKQLLEENPKFCLYLYDGLDKNGERIRKFDNENGIILLKSMKASLDWKAEDYIEKEDIEKEKINTTAKINMTTIEESKDSGKNI